MLNDIWGCGRTNSHIFISLGLQSVVHAQPNLLPVFMVPPVTLSTLWKESFGPDVGMNFLDLGLASPFFPSPPLLCFLSSSSRLLFSFSFLLPLLPTLFSFLPQPLSLLLSCNLFRLELTTTEPICCFSRDSEFFFYLPRALSPGETPSK